jgi:hypothetical protein
MTRGRERRAVDNPANDQQPEEGPPPETKPERREKKRRKKRNKMLQHGKGLTRVYRDVVKKRMSE